MKQKTGRNNNKTRNVNMAVVALLAFGGTLGANAHESIGGLECKTITNSYSVCVYRSESAECIILRGDDSSEIKCIGEREND